jgi:LysM repeat protein
MVESDCGPNPYYLVRPGDTLGAIATVYGISVPELARFNGIVDPDFVEVGRQVCVPPSPNTANQMASISRP